MKIAMFTNTYLPHVGGVARSVNILAEDLRRLGHKVLIIAPTFAKDMGYRHDLDDDNVIRVPAIQNFNGSDFSVRIPIPFQLADRLDDFQPDIIHSHHPFLLGDTAIRVARRMQKPLVFTHHTLYERYTHYVPLHSESMQQFAIHLSVEYANLCDAVIAPSESIYSLIKERGIESKIQVIPTGVDVEFFKSGDGDQIRAKYSIPKNAPLIGHLGRLAEEKNLVYLCEAVALTLQRNPNYWFILAGDGPAKSKLSAIFKRHNVSERVVWTGNCSGRQLASAYQAMDIFVFASHTETQGMVIAEAMASSLPVIALDAPGVREMVIDNVNGKLLTSNSDTLVFSNTIEETLASSDTVKAMAKEAFKTALSFSREICAQKVEGLYQSLTHESISDQAFEHKLSSLDKIAAKLKAEWELLSEKGIAAVKAISD